MPAIVGHLVQLAIWLRKDGEVFPGMTKVTTTVTSLEEGQTVVETSIRARQGHTVQSLQLYDGAPHTIAVTVRPVGSDARGWIPPTAVLNVDVVASAPAVHGAAQDASHIGWCAGGRDGHGFLRAPDVQGVD